MRKRKNSEEEDSEMDVDDEEKIETEDSEGEDGSDEEELEDAPQAQGREENPFLDSFYGLASDDARERSQAAQTMLHYCLLGPDANAKDASYALRRLWNGLCSGRAAARQGNASALASFLKIAFYAGKIEEIQTETMKGAKTKLSSLAFVRERLFSATDVGQITGKRKGSEERDYQFGRLFGILGIVRSNILLPTDDNDDSDVLEVSSSLLNDLVELFWLKKWLREPAAHGITTLLKLFYDGKEKESCKKISEHLVKRIVIPKILSRLSTGSSVESDRLALLKNYCSEQVGLAAYIQSNIEIHDKLEFPLNQPILSSETIPIIAETLGETSSVIQPRTHFVWDAIWTFLTKAVGKSNGVRPPFKRNLRHECPVDGGSAIDIVDSIVRVVVMEQLLRKGAQSGKATHERRALSLCIVKILCGVPFASSISGPTQLILNADTLENTVLTPDVVGSVFLDVIYAGNQKKQTSHLLKPLALDVLSSLTDSTLGLGDYNRQLALVRAFVSSEVRFDARTKTSTVANLLSFTKPIESEVSNAIPFWRSYLDFLETTLLSRSSNEDAGSSSAATGIVELLYSAGKSILRVTATNEGDENKLESFKEDTAKRILSFFMTSAFFECTNVKHKSRKQKKGKQQKSNQLLEFATKIQSNGLPYSLRSIVSARFFSFLSDFVHHSSHKVNEKVDGKSEKDTVALSTLVQLCDDWKELEACGATRYTTVDKEGDNEDDDDESPDPEAIISGLRKTVKELAVSAENDNQSTLKKAQKRCSTGITVLACTLHLHRLSCGSPDSLAENDDPDADDEEEDEEEICNALESLKMILDDFMKRDEESNPLLGLVELCSNILSSPLGSGNVGRGASPKLIREAVKYAWLGGLRLSSELASVDETMLDSNVIGILLQAIGAADESNAMGEDADFDEDGESDDDDDSDEDMDDDDDDDDEDSKESSNEILFSKVSEDMQVDASDEAEDDSDVELDHSKLQSILEDDSDAEIDVGELEHHEGADAALAKLIKLKQDMRKAGQQAKEKIEISHQLRCTFLIELLIGRPDGWNRLFRTMTLLELVLPMLKHRKKIEKSLDQATESGGKTSVGEKRALLERLTSLLNQKLCKLRLLSMPFTSSVDADYVSKLSSQIIDEVKRAGSKEHGLACSSCLVFVLRSIPDAKEALTVSSTCADVVSEWANKKGKVGASFFDSVITQMPSVAQGLFASPLCKASIAARSPFLKCEAYRLLSLIFSNKLNADGTDLEKLALEKSEEVGKEFLQGVMETLKDAEMRKAKRVRIVLKTLEKYVQALSSTCDGETITSLQEVEGLVVKLGQNENSSVQSLCTKLAEEIDAKVAELKESHTGSSNDTSSGNGQPNSASKKSKKKKKKKKR